MARTRSSNVSELRDVAGARTAAFAFVAFGVSLALACGGGAVLETATEPAKSPRRPDGVVLEPPPAMPQVADRAPASGVVALREPLADKDVEEVVRAYLRGFEREEIGALEQLLSQDATPIGRAGGRAQLLEVWRTRMRTFEYQKLAGTEVARFAQIERHSYDTLGVPGGAARPPEMRPGDVYVRVPIVTPRIGTEQLFGDILVLLLRREDGRLKIAGQADENGN